MGNSFQCLRNWKVLFEPPRLNFPYTDITHAVWRALQKLILTGIFFYFSFCRLMLPLLLLPALLTTVSWSIILLMTHLTLLCLTGKFLTANGINLHQKRFWAIMKSCKFYQSTVSYKGQCFSVTSLFFDV